MLTSGQIEKQLLHTKQRSFEQGDKAGKLAYLLAQTEAASRLIPGIRLVPDDTTSNPTTINNAFVDYYSKLYSSETSLCDWDGPNPLDLLMYPQIDPVVANELGAPITISEVKDAISSLQNNKSPGPTRPTPQLLPRF